MIFTYRTIVVCITGKSVVVSSRWSSSPDRRFLLVCAARVCVSSRSRAPLLWMVVLSTFCCYRWTGFFAADFWHLYDDEQKEVDDDDDVVDNSIFANTAKNIAFCTCTINCSSSSRRQYSRYMCIHMYIYIYRCGHSIALFFPTMRTTTATTISQIHVERFSSQFFQMFIYTRRIFPIKYWYFIHRF